MAYLEDRRYVHRDLAARNVLVAADNSFLVSDFGLSRALRGGEYYRVRQSAALPLRWCAPEVVVHLRYTSASDVWSFFMLMLEVWTRGQRPFRDLAASQVEETLKAAAALPEDDNSGRLALPFLGLTHPSSADPGMFAGLAAHCTRWEPLSTTPMGVNPVPSGSPHVHVRPMGRTCGAWPPNEIKEHQGKYPPEKLLHRTFPCAQASTPTPPGGRRLPSPRRQPFNSTPMGGQFDFVQPPARTMHPHGAYAW